MKFAREFKEALRQEGYPPHWLDSAIPYGQLKKCLKKVQQELLDLGLDPVTMRQLLATQTTSPGGSSIPLAKYDLAGSQHTLRPRLTVTVLLKDGVAVDASISPASKAVLEKLLASRAAAGLKPVATSDNASEASSPTESPASPEPPNEEIVDVSVGSDTSPPPEGKEEYERVEVPMVFDGEFFEILQHDVEGLDALQQHERESMTQDIVQLGHEIAQLTKPARRSKTDLSIWREIFELYLDAQVFFSSTEQTRGPRNSAAALKQLVWFQNEVQRRNLPGQFRLPASQQAYKRFLELNAHLLQNLKFQEINRMAITKILKKFDKRTSLGVRESFPTVVHSEHFMAENVAKDICAQVSRDLVSVVPRLDDYICPVCFSIAWLPVRLDCRHVFCVRCVIKMQREKQKFCPLCRGEVVMTANLDNLDKSLEKFMKKYFPQETKEKQRANEVERGIELFGEGYKHSSCTIM